MMYMCIYAQIYEGTSEDNLAHVDASIHISCMYIMIL